MKFLFPILLISLVALCNATASRTLKKEVFSRDAAAVAKMAGQEVANAKVAEAAAAKIKKEEEEAAKNIAASKAEVAKAQADQKAKLAEAKAKKSLATSEAKAKIAEAKTVVEKKMGKLTASRGRRRSRNIVRQAGSCSLLAALPGGFDAVQPRILSCATSALVSDERRLL